MWIQRVLFGVCAMQAISASEKLQDELWQDYTRAQHSTGRTWLFNNSVYQETYAGHWILADTKGAGGFEVWLKDFLDKGTCPKDHKGVYLDKRFNEQGVWCCQGVMENGQSCPYHIDVQFPKPNPEPAPEVKSGE